MALAQADAIDAKAASGGMPHQSCATGHCEGMISLALKAGTTPDHSCQSLLVRLRQKLFRPLDSMPLSGMDVGPLCGLPLAVKDSQDVYG